MKKRYPCLFCLSFDNPFTSEEHILPRGLGNVLKILPPGIVCDRCNNGELARLDEILTNFDPIKFLRVFHGIENRDGKVPASKHINVDMAMINPGHLNVLLKSNKSDYFQEHEKGFTLSVVGGHKLTNAYIKKLLRAFYKMGLEVVYGDLGARTAHAKRFDEIRRIVLGNCDFSGSLAVVKHPDLEQIARIRHHVIPMKGRKVSFFDFYYYGVEILYGMEVREIGDDENLLTGKVDIISASKCK